MLRPGTFKVTVTAESPKEASAVAMATGDALICMGFRVAATVGQRQGAISTVTTTFRHPTEEETRP